MNVWNFTGNLGKDCEVAVTQGGTTICKFSVAVSSGYGDNKKTTWVNCRIFGKRAEGQLPQYLTKGAKVAVSGECELAEWQSQDGTQNKALMVAVGSIDLIGDKQQAPTQNQGYQQAQQQAPQQGNGAPTAPHQQQPVQNGAAQYQQNASAPNAAPSHFNQAPQGTGGFDIDEKIPF